MHKKLWGKIKEKPGLSLLILLLTIITIASIKPQFYLLGWDNYSSYFNLKTNIFRTFFATWREYRGFGVPSDSESTDIFRQIFYLFFKPLFGEKLIDQIYILFAFNLGVVAMYFVAEKMAKTVFKNNSIQRQLDIFATFSAFFYAFNLNTLSTFYFPMVMFVNRFYMLPIFFLMILSIFNKDKFSFREFLLIFLSLLFISSSFMVATIFITILIALFFFIITNPNLKKTIIVISLFFCINAFWLLPFINYTIQKSDIIPYAPTFIEANETNLNKSKSFFSIFNQSVLYPNFFQTQFTDQETNQLTSFHPLAAMYNKFPTNIILLIFPVLCLFGALLSILAAKKNNRLLWLTVTLFFFLFLSLKKHSPLGFFYEFADKVIPYFAILFRFGDTKFHPFIAFSGSILTAFTLLFLMTRLTKLISPKKYLLFIFLLVFLPIIIIFKSYFNGNFIGFFMYNAIPQAYFDIANKINSEVYDVRVLHLPYSKNGYWKSYSWGFIGSSFFHYLINKPFMDPTFEPASIENAYFDQKINHLIDNFQLIQEEDEKNNRVLQLYSFLKTAGVGYIILDESVSTEVKPKNVIYWGDFNLADAKNIIFQLEKLGYMKKTYQQNINLADYGNSYQHLYPTKKTNLKSFSDIEEVPITLYELQSPNQKITFLDKTSNIDSQFNNIFSSTYAFYPDNFIQNEKEQFTIYPFQRSDGKLTKTKDGISFTLPIILTNSLFNAKSFKTNQQSSSLIEILAKKQEQNIILTLNYHYLPSINGHEFKMLLKKLEIPIDSIDSETNLRLNIENNIFSIPPLSTNDTLVGYTIVHQNPIQLVILQQKQSNSLKLANFSLTQNPNCFFDSTIDYFSNLTFNNNGLVVDSKNGSTCFWQNVENIFNNESSYAEFTMNVQANQENLEGLYGLNFNYTSKPTLKRFVNSLAKPNIFRFCFQEGNIDQCLNRNQLFDLNGKTSLTIPINHDASSIFNPLLLLSLKNMGYQKQELTMNNITVNLFQTFVTENLEIPTVSSLSEPVAFDNVQDLTISFPIAQSTYSFNNHYPAELSLSNKPCEEKNRYRTFRTFNNNLISYFENCSNEISANIPFSSNNFYLWMINYNLGSGKFPLFRIEDSLDAYKNELVSLNQGYPNIQGFKAFQNPEFFNSTSLVEDKFNNLNLQSAYTFVYPHPEYADFKAKNFTLHQDSENEGLLSLGSFQIVELPNSWENISLEPANSRKAYTAPSNFSYQSILPSLWKVDVIGVKPANNLLLYFNEAYDEQWKIYTSIVDAVFGFNTAGTNTKCNGYANCFELPQKNTDQTFYIFYVPERLNFLGWSITLISFPIFAFVFVKKSTPER